MQANVEVYGGPILSTFFDRPLCIAGRLAVKSDNILEPKMLDINIQKPVAIIASLAIHMSRAIIEAGNKIDKQVHLLPIFGIIEETMNKDNYLLNFIAEAAHIAAEDILDYELCLYNPEKPSLIGINDDFISAPRLDDITSACAAVYGLIDSTPSDKIAMTVLFDNEEIGSQTKQGADSTMLDRILEKIWASFGESRVKYISDLHGSMILSADVGHGYHPNYPGVYDITTLPVLGKGFVIKTDSNQKYSWDCQASGGLKQLCKAKDIPYQCCEALRPGRRRYYRLADFISAANQNRGPWRTAFIHAFRTRAYGYKGPGSAHPRYERIFQFIVTKNSSDTLKHRRNFILIIISLIIS